MVFHSDKIQCFQSPWFRSDKDHSREDIRVMVVMPTINEVSHVYGDLRCDVRGDIRRLSHGLGSRSIWWCETGACGDWLASDSGRKFDTYVLNWCFLGEEIRCLRYYVNSVIWLFCFIFSLTVQCLSERSVKCSIHFLRNLWLYIFTYKTITYPNQHPVTLPKIFSSLTAYQVLFSRGKINQSNRDLKFMKYVNSWVGVHFLEWMRWRRLRYWHAKMSVLITVAHRTVSCILCISTYHPLTWTTRFKNP